jgi:serine/threonine-protein kinase HipA
MMCELRFGGKRLRRRSFQSISGPKTDQPVRALRLIGRPLLAGNDGLPLSLAGARAKISVALVDGRAALPKPGQPTTQIIKPEIERSAGSVQNEAWCMTLAPRVGPPTAHEEVRQAEGHPYLLVERYDCVSTAGGITLRLHQEGACQALGAPPEGKYAAEGGPAFRDLFVLTRGYAKVPAPAVLTCSTWRSSIS